MNSRYVGMYRLFSRKIGYVKFMFSKKTEKFDEIFTVYMMLCIKCQIYGEDFFNFRGLLRQYEPYSTIFLKCNVFPCKHVSRLWTDSR